MKITKITEKLPKEGILFTQEEYNKHIKEIIENALKNGAENAETKNKPKFLGDYNPVVDEDSILNTFEKTYLKYKI